MEFSAWLLIAVCASRAPGLSDGTLRILTLTLLPYLSKQPAILVTEEPENGIHPRAIEAVLQSLSSMYDSQVWVSSHSPVVLARAKLEQLLCARLASEGGVEMVAGTDQVAGERTPHGGVLDASVPSCRLTDLDRELMIRLAGGLRAAVG